MKFIRQFLIILAVTFIGEILHAVIPLPVPASIYGMLLMLGGLTTKVIPLDMVKEAGGFLIEIMPLMFIPPAAGLLISWAQLREVFVPVAVITVVTTVLVMAVTGRVTQFVLKREKRRGEKI